MLMSKCFRDARQWDARPISCVVLLPMRAILRSMHEKGCAWSHLETKVQFSVAATAGDVYGVRHGHAI